MKSLHQYSDQEIKDRIYFLKLKQLSDESSEKSEIIAKVSFQSKIAVLIYLIGLLVIVFSATWVVGFIVGNILAAFIMTGFVLLFAGFFLLSFYPNWISKRLERYFEIILKDSYGNRYRRKTN